MEPASLEPCPESPSSNRSPEAKALQLLLLTMVRKGARCRGLLLCAWWGCGRAGAQRWAAGRPPHSLPGAL